MTEGKKSKKPSTKPIPVRFPEGLIRALDEASRESGISQQELIRLATAVGLKTLRRINFDVAASIDEKATRDEQL
ncbi:MAG TPA: hypothetical protein VNB29_09220 [Chthoniobacterales bacterium]|jgi:hypothetical protein|nr:hypothetical protein [Chthoniobacterales bacterium]